MTKEQATKQAIYHIEGFYQRLGIEEPTEAEGFAHDLIVLAEELLTAARDFYKVAE